MIPVEELHRLMFESVEPGPEDHLAQQEEHTMDTQRKGILIGTAEDLEVAHTWLGGRTCVQNPWAVSGKTKQALSRPQTRANTTGRGVDTKTTPACEFKQFLCENDAGCRNVRKAVQTSLRRDTEGRQYPRGAALWACSEGADDVSHHTLAEGVGLGTGAVGVFCSRHARILQEVDDNMSLALAAEPESSQREEDEQAEVDRIIQHRDHKVLGSQYKVRWVGFNNTRNLEELMGALGGSQLPGALDEFPGTSTTTRNAGRFDGRCTSGEILLRTPN